MYQSGIRRAQALSCYEPLSLHAAEMAIISNISAATEECAFVIDENLCVFRKKTKER